MARGQEKFVQDMLVHWPADDVQAIWPWLVLLWKDGHLKKKHAVDVESQHMLFVTYLFLFF